MVLIPSQVECEEALVLVTEASEIVRTVVVGVLLVPPAPPFLSPVRLMGLPSTSVVLLCRTVVLPLVVTFLLSWPILPLVRMWPQETVLLASLSLALLLAETLIFAMSVP